MKIDIYLKSLAVLKDTLIVSIIGILGWRYFPLLVDPAQTSNFEIAEINLLVVKLKPEASERAVMAENSEGLVDVAASADPSDEEFGGGATEDDNSSPVEQKRMTYYAQQRAGEFTQEQIAIPSRNIISRQDQLREVSIRGWSYVGTYKDGVYTDLIFDLDNSVAPEKLVGLEITAKTDVFVRDDYPKFVLGWTKGDRKGVLQAGAELEVTAVELIPAKGGGHRIWVRS